MSEENIGFVWTFNDSSGKVVRTPYLNCAWTVVPGGGKHAVFYDREGPNRTAPKPFVYIEENGDTPTRTYVRPEDVRGGYTGGEAWVPAPFDPNAMTHTTQAEELDASLKNGIDPTNRFSNMAIVDTFNTSVSGGDYGFTSNITLDKAPGDPEDFVTSLPEGLKLEIV